MKKRGFTLIELLAVIVILAIIALIATPIIMNVIENTKKGAAERSAENYMRAVETTVATERIKGNVLEGQYNILENGNLCLEGEICSDETDIDIDMNGNKPSSGTVYINNGKVTTDSIFTVGEYNVSYDESGSLKAEKIENDSEGDSGNDTLTLSDVCRYQGTDESKKYELGAEYECELGDGVPRTFYVLEDGDTTELEKTDGSLHYDTADPGIGTAGDGEVALIMNQNIDTTTLKWCSSGNSNTCNGDEAKLYLESQTSSWIVEVSLPTYAQIKQANGGNISGAPIWLHDYLSGATHSVSGILAYWTYTANSAGSRSAWRMRYDGRLSGTNVDSGHSYGVRPVITIAKD